MGYPPPPGPPPGPPTGPPPGGPGGPGGSGYGPPTGPPPGGPGHGPPTGPPPGYRPPGPPPGYVPPPQPPTGPGYGGPPAGRGGGGPIGGAPGSSNRPLILLMSALVVVAVLLVVGFFVLQAQDGGDEAVELTSGQLEDALLTPEDLDGEWIAEDPTEGGEINSTDIDGDEACVQLWEDLEAHGSVYVAESPTNGVEALLFDEGRGSELDQELSSGSSVDLDQVREFFATCGTFDADLDGTAATVSHDVVDPIAEVGDDAVSVEITVDIDEPEDLSFEIAMVVWERSGSQSYVSLTQYDVDTGEYVAPDVDVLADAVEAADQKLATAIEQAG